MKKPIRNVLRKSFLVAIFSAVLFLLPVLTRGFSPAQSAVMLAILYAAAAVSWAVTMMYRKLFPNLVRAHEKEKTNRTFVGDGDI